MKAVTRALRLALVAALAVAACHRDLPPRVRLKAIERCQDGTRAAVQKNSHEAAMRVYYAECASLYVELGCKEAFVHASKARREEQLSIVVEGCRRAYCPIGKSLEACTPGFVTTRDSAERAWTPLNDAILKYDAGAYLPQIQEILYWFFVNAPKGAEP